MMTAGARPERSELPADFPGSQCAPARHGGQDPVPDPRARPGSAALSDQGEDAARLGRSDKLIPPVYAQAFQRGIADAEVVMIPRAGHVAPFEQPAEVIGAIARLQ